VLQVEVPWARNGADFTLLFESFVMTLCREMPVNKVSQIKIPAASSGVFNRILFYISPQVAGNKTPRDLIFSQ
jgi:hypothetical protein